MHLFELKRPVQGNAVLAHRLADAAMFVIWAGFFSVFGHPWSSGTGNAEARLSFEVRNVTSQFVNVVETTRRTAVRFKGGVGVIGDADIVHV